MAVNFIKTYIHTCIYESRSKVFENKIKRKKLKVSLVLLLLIVVSIEIGM